MTAYCPHCNDFNDVVEVSKRETITVKKDQVEILAEFYMCQNCGNDFSNLKQEEDNLRKAYEIYRENHNLINPDKMSSIRRKYGLSQRQLARLLGWSESIVSQYESGRIQDRVHNDEMILLQDPRNMMTLYHQNKSLLNESERAVVGERIRIAAFKPDILFKRDCDRLQEEYFDYDPDEFSGNRRFNMSKFIDLLLIILEKTGPTYKTKLNKLPFYIDFLYHKVFGESITGMKYLKWQFGPVPTEYHKIYGLLCGAKFIGVEERIINGEPCELYSAIKKPDISQFSTNEKNVIDAVVKKFMGFTAEQIMKYSHNEATYNSTEEGAVIDYRHSRSLSLDLDSEKSE